MMNQNWSRSSFPTPLNTGSFMEFTILDSGCGGGGDVGDGVSGGDEDGGDVDGWNEGVGSVGIRGNPCLIN